MYTNGFLSLEIQFKKKYHQTSFCSADGNKNCEQSGDRNDILAVHVGTCFSEGRFIAYR